MFPVEPFLVSAMVVGLAEIGDKTQLLSLLLAARFRRPFPIICGILVATVANHALAAFAGTLLGNVLAGPWMRWILALSFFGVAVWALFPDKCEAETEPVGRAGAFVSTTVAFFLAEIGDKTQIATIELAARFDVFSWVLIGTTLGMMLANVPVVVLGSSFAARLPVAPIRLAAAGVFFALGVIVLIFG